MKYNKLISYLHNTDMCNGVIFKSFKCILFTSFTSFIYVLYDFKQLILPRNNIISIAVAPFGNTYLHFGDIPIAGIINYYLVLQSFSNKNK